MSPELKKIRPVTKEEGRLYTAKVLKKLYGCEVKNINYKGGGSFGFVYKALIDKEPFVLIVKLFRTDGICEREKAELKKLGEDSLVKIPQVYFTFGETQEIPADFLGMEFARGTDCFTDFSKLLKSKKAKERFADEVTAALHHWHEKTNDKFGLLGNAVYEGWLDFYRPFAEEILEGARKLTKENRLEKKVLDTMERAMGAFDYIFSEKVEKASLIHGDMNVMNIMSDKDLRVTAIIDPLESKWADREYELFQLRNLTGDKFGLYEKYKEKYGASEKCDIKTAFYALYHEVYAYIISGNKVNFILMPLVKRMNRELKKNKV